MTIDLPYGNAAIPFEFDAREFDALDGPEMPALTDAEIGDALDRPIDSPPLDEIVSAGESVLIVVPDATRRAAAGQITNLLVRRLIAMGIAPYDIAVIFATGIHRAVSTEEKAEIVTPFIAQRIKMLDHAPRDLMRIAGVGDGGHFERVGELPDGSPVEFNRVLSEFDRVITVGGVGFHYFAGVGGGRKLICPGLASAATAAATHRLAFDLETLGRAKGVGPGRLDGNPVHEAFEKAVSYTPPSFAVNTIVNAAGAAASVYCGHWRTSHRAACDAYAASHSLSIAERRPLVIASAGGSPYDIDIIQAHKALDAAAAACEPGGTIVLVAECPDGPGRAALMNWFDAKNSTEVGEKLREGYNISGQTAWSILRKTEDFDVRLISAISDGDAKAMRSRKFRDIGHALAETRGPGYILPHASRILISCD